MRRLNSDSIGIRDRRRLVLSKQREQISDFVLDQLLQNLNYLTAVSEGRQDGRTGRRKYDVSKMMMMMIMPLFSSYFVEMKGGVFALSDGIPFVTHDLLEAIPFLASLSSFF